MIDAPATNDNCETSVGPAAEVFAFLPYSAAIGRCVLPQSTIPAKADCPEPRSPKGSRGFQTGFQRPLSRPMARAACSSSRFLLASRWRSIWRSRSCVVLSLSRTASVSGLRTPRKAEYAAHGRGAKMGGRPFMQATHKPCGDGLGFGEFAERSAIGVPEQAVQQLVVLSGVGDGGPGPAGVEDAGRGAMGASSARRLRANISTLALAAP